MGGIAIELELEVNARRRSRCGSATPPSPSTVSSMPTGVAKSRHAPAADARQKARISSSARSRDSRHRGLRYCGIPSKKLAPTLRSSASRMALSISAAIRRFASGGYPLSHRPRSAARCRLRVQAKRRLEAGILEIELPRDQHERRNSAIVSCGDRCGRLLNISPPGTRRSTSRFTLAFDLDLDPRKHLRRRV